MNKLYGSIMCNMEKFITDRSELLCSTGRGSPFPKEQVIKLDRVSLLMTDPPPTNSTIMGSLPEKNSLFLAFFKGWGGVVFVPYFTRES